MCDIDRVSFCQAMYDSNPEFKGFVDRTCNAGSYTDRKIPDIFAHQTIYDVAVYFSKKNEDAVEYDVKPVKIEEEDKSC
jgi:hypothetical protein